MGREGEKDRSSEAVDRRREGGEEEGEVDSRRGRGRVGEEREKER